MYDYSLSDALKEKLRKLYKKDRKRHEICMKKIEEILANPEHYKPLRHEMKNLRRVHIEKSFVLVFTFRNNLLEFLELEHHDKIYR
jgi:mRNA interferase RelE/StbE/toxin YoeB